MGEQQLALLQSVFEAARNEENSVPMEKYMRGKFTFFGLRAAERRQLAREFLRDVNFHNVNIESIIRALWEMPEREYQYVAVDYLVRNKRHLTREHLDLVEELITTKSWWDTVDLIANHLVGTLFSKHPELIKTCGAEWLRSDNMWLKRSMILFQLKYKEATDHELLFSIIEETRHIDELFYSKSDRLGVEGVLENES